jgi:MFS family permease
MKNMMPWLMVFMAFLAMTISNGMSITGLSVFDESLINEFGWERSGLKFRDFITFGVAGLLSPLMGIVIDKIGVHRVMVVGFALLAIAYFLYPHLDSLPTLYGIHIILGVVVICCGLNPCMILVSSWFREKRGTAIGIALMGSSLGGVIFPQLGTFLLKHDTWRSAFLNEMVIALVMMVLAALLIRNKPADDNGAKMVVDKAIVAADPNDMSYSDAIKTKTFWALAIIAMTTFYTILGAQAHLFLYLRDLDFSAQTATNAISLLFGGGIIGKVFFGWLADKFDQKTILIGNIVLMFVGSILLAMMNSTLIWVAIIAFGFGWGGIYTLLQLTAINSFGLTSAGKILGTITILDALGGGSGIWLTGVFFEISDKSYALAFQIFCTLLFIALLAATQIKPIKQPV